MALILSNILFTYLFFLLSSIHCYIKIPIKYYPNKIFNETNPSNTMHNIVNQNLYATIELGSPKQKIQIPIAFETNDFYISKSYTKMNDDKSKNYNLEYFDEESSNSIVYIDEQDVYYGVNFLLGTKVKDLFYFGNKQFETEFFLAEHLTEAMPGELGLQLYPISDLNSAFDSIEKTFLKIIKNKGLINNYVCSILFEKNNNMNNENIDGYLYIGDYLHNINNNYDYNTLNSINAYIFQNVVLPEFEMTKLIIYKNNNPNDIIKEIKLQRNYMRVNLDYNFCGIQGSEIIRPYLEENLFTKENNCYKDFFFYKGKFYFYYCDNNPSIINRIKNNFPTIRFSHQDFNYDFIIKGDDLFIEKGGYVYCLMIFGDYKMYNWKLGKPFLNKYTFMIDEESKKILFYSVEDNVNTRGIKKDNLIWLVILLVIIFSFLGFILARKIYRTHIRKLKNVLDDDFEYNTPEKKYKNKNNIEMSRKLYEE